MSAPTLSERTVSAGQWRMAAWSVQAALQLGLGVVLARLLPPRDFGVAALATVVVGFAAMLYQFGLGVPVVQRRPLTERHVRAAFTASLLVGAALAALLWLLAPLSPVLLREPELPRVLRLVALVFVCGGVGTTARALLQRSLDFRALFTVDVVSYGVGYGGVAVALALAGHGVWSLAWGSVVQALLGAGLALAAARHPLRPLLARRELGDLCGLGAAASLNQAANYVARNADNLLVGRLLGAAALGVYARAFSLMALPLAAVGDVMWQVLLPAMAEVKDDRARLGRAYLAAVQASVLVAAPLMAGIAAAAPHLAVGLYGPAWAAMALPLQVLCAAGVFRAVYHVSGALTHASGRVYSEVWRQAVYAALVVAGTVLGARWGVAGVALAVAGAVTFMYLAMARLSLAIVGRTWREFFAAQLPGAVLGAGVGGAVLVVSGLLERQGASSLAIFAADVAAAGAALLLGLAALPEPLRPAELFARLEGSVRRLPAPLRLPLARVLRLPAPGPAAAPGAAAGAALPGAARVSLCVCTFRRPHGLRRLLEALGRATTARVGALEVVVVDNDPEGSAQATVEEMRARLPWQLRYVAEPRRGISYARNRAVAAAADDAEWIAFLDDDEEPEPGWLDELLRVQAAYAADVVSGPVMPRFEARVPRWMVRGRFFEVPRHPTGTELPYADTGNVLVRASVLRATERPFPERLALTGGADTHFFLRVARAGHRIVWADEALAWEWVPPSRTTLGWLLRRAFRRGNIWAFCERELDPSPRVGALRLVKATGRIARGALLLPLAGVRGRHAAVAALRGICFGAGSLAALAGFRYSEYRTTHGR